MYYSNPYYMLYLLIIVVVGLFWAARRTAINWKYERLRWEASTQKPAEYIVDYRTDIFDRTPGQRRLAQNHNLLKELQILFKTSGDHRKAQIIADGFEKLRVAKAKHSLKKYYELQQR